jgi:hypothetical protein
MSAAVRIEAGPRTAHLFGEGRHIVPALKLTRTPRQWDPRRKAWMVSIGRLGDVIAAIEYRLGADVELIEVDR